MNSITVVDDGDRWQVALVCDTCSDRITDVNTAVVVWSDDTPADWRAFHKGACDRCDGPAYTWMELRTFLGLALESCLPSDCERRGYPEPRVVYGEVAV